MSEENKTGTKLSFLIMAILVAAFVGASVYANIWKDARRVAEVVVEGNRIVSSKDIITLAKVPSNAPLFGLDLFVIQQRIMKNAFIGSVAVHRDIPDRVRITVEERVPVAALVADKLYYLDASGFVLPAVSSQYIFDLPVLTGDVATAECIPGRQIRNNSAREALKLLSLAKEIDEELYRNISEIRPEGGTDFLLYTAEFGIPVLVARQNLGPQLVKFDGFWKSVVAHRGSHQLQYIDLRFENQVVVRWNRSGQDVNS